GGNVHSLMTAPAEPTRPPWHRARGFLLPPAPFPGAILSGRLPRRRLHECARACNGGDFRLPAAARVGPRGPLPAVRGCPPAALRRRCPVRGRATRRRPVPALPGRVARAVRRAGVVPSLAPLGRRRRSAAPRPGPPVGKRRRGEPATPG